MNLLFKILNIGILTIIVIYALHSRYLLAVPRQYVTYILYLNIIKTICSTYLLPIITVEQLG